MMHERAETLLTEWRGGMLSCGEAEEVAAHVEACAECRGLLEVLEAAGAYLSHEKSVFDGHLSKAEIVEAGMEYRGTGAADRERLEAHLETCEECREEVRAVRECETNLRERRAIPFRSPWIPAAAAAGLLVALLAYPAWRGLVDLPGLERETRVLREAQRQSTLEIASLEESLRESKEWSGPVNLVPVRGGTRSGSEEATQVAIRPGDRFVSLAVDPALTGGDPDDLAFRFSLAAEGETTLWEKSLTAVEVREYSRSTGLLVLVIPVEKLDDGPMVLTVTAGEGEGSRIRSRAALRVQRQSPTATNEPQ